MSNTTIVYLKEKARAKADLQNASEDEILTAWMLVEMEELRKITKNNEVGIETTFWLLIFAIATTFISVITFFCIN